MRTRLAIRLHHWAERYFPERRVFLRSDNDVRFIRLRPGTQILGSLGAALIVAWAIIATSILIMDNIGAGNFREQAKRDLRTYEERLNQMAVERDARAAEAVAAQQRFGTALAQISVMQSELLASETRRRELETGIEVIQGSLRRALDERDVARKAEAELFASLKSKDQGGVPLTETPAEAGQTMTILATALEATARERDRMFADAQDAVSAADELAFEIRLMEEKNDQIFRQLEEAMTVSVEPLDKMFRNAGMDTDRILDQVRRGYSGQGGPLTPISFSTRGEEPSAEEERANRILGQMDRLNLYRIAAEKAPFAVPVQSAYRFTSGYGYRRDPKTGGRRMHNGVDFAGRSGTPLYSTADGVVVHAGWQSGYGRLVAIRHEFGIETRYAHLSAVSVSKGQRVSRGDKIGAMGASGRTTGVHLHYEIRVGGKPVNPMTYIKAARNVF